MLGLQAQDPAEFEKLVRPGNPTLQVALFANEGGRPGMRLVDFLMPGPRGPLPAVETRSRSLDEPGVHLIGKTASMQRLLVRNPILLSLCPAAAAARLVEEAIAHDPEHVGPPVDIVRLDGRSVEWLERKAGCGPQHR